MKKLTALLPLSISIATALATAAHAQATGLQWSLPPEEQVVKALDGHPTVEAAGKRVGAASAASDMLRVGPHEVQLTGSYINRDVRLERNYTEFDGTVSRSFRLPGKAALDREAGQLGVEVAQNRMEDTRHQAALYLSQLWYDWLTASELNRTDQSNVALLERGLAAVKRRVQLRDASMLDTDQAQAALDQAKGVAAASLADMEQARALLQSNFPDLALPPEAPSLADPVLPSQDLTALHDLVIQRSHEIGAADREALRLEVVARRARADRLPDPQLGVRAFSLSYSRRSVSGPLWAFAAAGCIARTTGIAGVCFTAFGLMGFSG
ncbi:TolC family protein (plasmid) [Sphingobium amiense]|uniref:TolC family protein n=1 Tax=Sphingobium amiense TaxID=135719 RepID=A0A494W6E1_9SPHN|nr:TolC family protein [Sphingobium amiense]BBE00135.1 TolC family protein [Sphingobium amiense]